MTAGALIGGFSGVFLVSFGVAATGKGSLAGFASLGVDMNCGGCGAGSGFAVDVSTEYSDGVSSTVLGR